MPYVQIFVGFRIEDKKCKKYWLNKINFIHLLLFPFPFNCQLVTIQKAKKSQIYAKSMLPYTDNFPWQTTTKNIKIIWTTLNWQNDFRLLNLNDIKQYLGSSYTSNTNCSAKGSKFSSHTKTLKSSFCNLPCSRNKYCKTSTEEPYLAAKLLI